MEVHFDTSLFFTEKDETVITQILMRKEASLDFIPPVGFEFNFEGIYEEGQLYSANVSAVSYNVDTEILSITLDDCATSENEEFGTIVSGMLESNWEVVEDDSPIDTEVDSEEDDDEDSSLEITD